MRKKQKERTRERNRQKEKKKEQVKETERSNERKNKIKNKEKRKKKARQWKNTRKKKSSDALDLIKADLQERTRERNRKKESTIEGNENKGCHKLNRKNKQKETKKLGQEKETFCK